MKNKILLLKLLEEYTDVNHRLTQEELRKIPGASDVMGYKSTFVKRLYELADAFNRDEDGNLLPVSQWRIVFDGYKTGNGKHIKGVRTGKIFYRRRNTDLNLHEIDTDTTNCVYANIEIIQSAIANGQMIEFRMAGVDKNNVTFEKKEREYLISPYDIVFYAGKYWLLCNCQREYESLKSKSVKFSSHVDIYRIDKMQGVCVAKDARGIKPVRNPFYTRNERTLWDKQISYVHKGQMLPAKEFVFRIIWENFPEKERKDYSFIRDAFGDNWEYKSGKVHVKATPEFFLDWAFANADKIEIDAKNADSINVADALKSRLNTALNNLKKV